MLRFFAYWLDNKKITFMVIGALFLVGIFSWFTIPKQYNPDIIVPAFQIVIPAPGYSSLEVQKLIIVPLERKIKEVEGVDHIKSVAHRDYGASMVMFKVGVDKEDAYTRLWSKLQANMDLKPLGVGNPIIKPIDPDEIPIYTIGLVFTDAFKKSTSLNEGSTVGFLTNFSKDHTGQPKEVGSGKKEAIETDAFVHMNNLITQRKIANDVVQRIQEIENVGTVYVVGGIKDTITIKVNPDAVEARGTDILRIYDVLAKNNLIMPGGLLKHDAVNYPIVVDANTSTVEAIKKLVLSYANGQPLYLEDVATVYRGIPRKTYETFFVSFDKQLPQDTVYIGIAKKRGTNAVDTVKEIKEKLASIQKHFPVGIELVTIQDEGKKAKEATDSLITNLFESMAILFVTIFLFLGLKDAISASFSIPLVLAITFGVALTIGDNVNRITLFALILVLGMLVDDAILVVDNIARHVKLAKQTGKPVREAILDALQEVWMPGIFSTLTRLVSFTGMFFVTGMMGQYMGPIPKYAIIALTMSTIVAFSIIPVFSHIFATHNASFPTLPLVQGRREGMKNTIATLAKKLLPRIENFVRKGKSKESNVSGSLSDQENNLPTEGIIGKYVKIMRRILDPNHAKYKRLVKISFWVLLGVFFVVFPALGVFRWRMLPKSNMDQIYLWLDTPVASNFTKTQQVASGMVEVLRDFFHDKHAGSKQYVKDLRIIDSISVRIGIPPTLDFANTFRGSLMRDGEKYVSMRINLLPKEKRKVTSEEFVIKIRPVLQEWLQKNYPDVKMRLLEDPPGPPVMATFELKVKGSTTSSYGTLETIATWLYTKVRPILHKHDVVDHETSKERYQTSVLIKLDHEAISKANLTAQQVAMTIYTLFGGMVVSTYHDQYAVEPPTIVMIAQDAFDRYKDVTFTNPEGKKIPLASIAKVVPTQADIIRWHDEGMPTVTVYGEMGNNSVIYPVISLISAFLKKDFWEGRFEVINRNLYGFKIREKGTDDVYHISFGGERELTMDTFRDLGIAMIVSLIFLYFLVAARFKSFGLGGVIMLPFLLGFFGVLPGFSFLYLLQNEYFSATSMIGVIALAGISIGNSIILLEYILELLEKGIPLREAVIRSGAIRLSPIALSSLTSVIGAAMIIGDPVWSGLARSLIRGLSMSAFLTMFLVPIFLYDTMQKNTDTASIGV